MKHCFYFYKLFEQQTAQKIAQHLSAIEGISEVELDFSSHSLRLKSQIEDTYELVKSIARQYSKDIELNEDTGYKVDNTARVIKLVDLVLHICFFALLLVGHFTNNQSMTIIFGILFYLVVSRKLLFNAVLSIFEGKAFNELILFTVATIAAMSQGKFLEAYAVVGFFRAAEFFNQAASEKSKKSIRALLKLRSNEVVVLRQGKEISVNPITVDSGETIIINAGEKIALDGEIISGESEIDNSALTGEALPQFVKAGDSVLSGTINLTSPLKIKVTAPYAQSTVNKILDMVESAAQRKAGTDGFIKKFTQAYAPIALIMGLIIGLFSVLLWNEAWQDAVYRATIFLLISCPCALLLSIPVGYFYGIGRASKNGVLVKGSRFLSALGSLSAVIFDKTGTLTKGVFEVTKVMPLNTDAEGLVRVAALIEGQSSHPIAKAIYRYAQSRNISFEGMEMSEYQEYAGKGIRARVNGEYILCGNKRFLGDFSLVYPNILEDGSAVYVYNESKSQFLGMIIAGDTVKEDSLDTINQLKQMQIKTIMLSGDNKPSVTKAAKALGITEYFAELYPEAKVEVLEGLYEQLSFNNNIAFVGDGINDSPVLARANVGIAMGGMGSEAAIEAADVVIMNDELKKIPFIIGLARFTQRVCRQNLFIAAAIKAVILSLALFGQMGVWLALLVDGIICLLALINSLRISKKSF